MELQASVGNWEGGGIREGSCHTTVHLGRELYCCGIRGGSCNSRPKRRAGLLVPFFIQRLSELVGFGEKETGMEHHRPRRANPRLQLTERIVIWCSELE